MEWHIVNPFLHLHKTVLNLFSFASPCFAVICVFVAKKMFSLDGRTFTHYKVAVFYLCVRKFYMSTQMIFHLELYLCYKYKTHIQIDLRTLHPRQIIAIIRKKWSSPLINRSTSRKKRRSSWWRLSPVPMAWLCHFLATLSLHPLHDGLFEGLVERFYSMM